ncbi:MAG TPA: autotransporter domain-containing protein, partial [Stellaceae bacterium]|nr:autotransporter domain-containing protein [Stellaceae bacterium]
MVDASSTVGGSIINTGLISATGGGGYNAVGILVGGIVAGGITNTGTIIGGTAAIDVSQEQAPTTIVQAGGLIQGAIMLSANADKLVLTGGVLNGAVAAPAGSAATVSVPSGMPTLAPGTTIGGVASFTQTGGTLVLPLTTNTAPGNFATVSAGAINLNGTLLASLQGSFATLASSPTLVFKDVFVSGTPIINGETVTTPSFLFAASLVPDATTANALDLSVALSPAAEALTAQVLAQALRFGLVGQQNLIDTVENRLQVSRGEQGPGLQFASASGDRLTVSDADQQAQVPAGGTGVGAAAWAHEFLDASQTLTAQLAGTAASPFTFVGTSFGRDSAVVGVGVSHEFAPGASFFVDYDGKFTGGFNQN